MVNKGVINRLSTVLLTILCSIVIFGCALWASGYAHAADVGEEPPATSYRYELETVAVNRKGDWVFSNSTQAEYIYQMVSVTVTYIDNDDASEDAKKTYGLELDGTKDGDYYIAATGEKVKFDYKTTSSVATVTATVVPTADGYDPNSVSGTSQSYALVEHTQDYYGIRAIYEPSTTDTIKTDTELNGGTLISCIKVYYVYKDGSESPNKATETPTISGSLFPANIINKDTNNLYVAGDTYDKSVTVSATINGVTQSTSVMITDIEFVEPQAVSKINANNFQAQTARSTAINLTGVIIEFEYEWNEVEAQATTFPYSWFDFEYFTGKQCEENTKTDRFSIDVHSIKIKFTYKKGETGEKPEKTVNRRDITVSRINIDAPHFYEETPDIEGTPKALAWNDGASIKISQWKYSTLHTDTGKAPNPQISVFKLVDNSGATVESPLTDEEKAALLVKTTDGDSYTLTEIENAVAGTPIQIISSDGVITVHFPKAGFKYRIKVTLSKVNDFQWGRAFNGRKSDDKMTMSFDVQVDKGTPVVELTGIASATGKTSIIYGDSYTDGTLTAKIDEKKIGDGKWVCESADNADRHKDDDNAWYYHLEYYDDQGAKVTDNDMVEGANGIKRPKNAGTYKAVAVTHENGGYYSASVPIASACEFTIEQFEIDITKDKKDHTYVRAKTYSIEDFLPALASANLPYSENITDILDITTKDSAENVVTAFEHANKYTTTVTLKSTAANYKLKAGTSSAEFSISTAITTFDFSAKGWTYGAGDADPNIQITTKSSPYYPSATGTLDTDYTVEYFEYSASADNHVGAPYTVPTKDGTPDFSQVPVGSYVIKLTAKKDESTTERQNETAGPVADTTVDYTLPVMYQTIEVTAKAIVAPTLGGDWSLNGGLEEIYTYDDTENGKEFTLTDWIGDANNTPASGENIITVTIKYEKFVTSGGNDVTFAAGKFTVNYAGNYTVTITLNKNYSWDKGKEESPIWYPTDSEGEMLYTYSYTGKVARQQLAVLNDITGTENVYSGEKQDKTIGNWNGNALKIADIAGKTIVESGTPADITTGITGKDAETVTAPTTGKFGVTYAGEYTVTVRIADQDNYEWNIVGGSDELADKSLTYTLDRAPLVVEWSDDKGSYPGTLDGSNYPNFVFDDTLKNGQKKPTATAQVFSGDVISIDTTVVYSDGTFSSVVGQIDEKNTYYIAVTAFSGADAANYYLPKFADDNFTNIATIFEITALTLERPVLVDSKDGAIIDNGNNTITVIYHGAVGYQISDFIKEYALQYVSGDIARLDIDLPKCVDANIDGYEINVKPADNYTWKDESRTEVKFKFIINPAAVDIQWNESSLKSVYSSTKIEEPTYTVKGTFDGDEFTLELGYKKTAITDAEDVTLINAGNYIVYAKSLVVKDGNSAKVNNYIISDEDDYYSNFVVAKKALAKPTFDISQENTTFGSGTVSNKLYSNSENEIADWNNNGMLFEAAVTAKRDKTWFTDTVADNDPVLTIDTSAEDKYSFDTATGQLTYYAAGIYTITFTLFDSSNYCWIGEGKEQDFKDGVSYTCKWENKFNVDRKEVDAPTLGSNRAMEAEKPITDLSTVFTGATDGMRYGVMYGNRNTENGEIIKPATSEQQGGGLNGQPAQMGQYYAVLTADDGYNYTWTVPADDGKGGFIGSGFITAIDGKVYVIEYTTDVGARVYLLYAITATQVNVLLDITDYTYGDNGYAIGETEIVKANKFVRDHTYAEFGDKKVFDFRNLTESVLVDDVTYNQLPEIQTLSYKIYKITDTTRTEVSESDLIQGLPWGAGSYEADITIEFKESKAYQKWTGTRAFTVEKREVEITWTHTNDEYKQIGIASDAKLSKEYNGVKNEFTYSVTNVPKKNVSDSSTAPTLTVVTDTKSGTSFTGATKLLDVGTYRVSIDGSKFADDNFSAHDVSAKHVEFTVTPKKITLVTNGGTHVYGNALEFAASTYFTETTKGQFYTRDFALDKDIGSLVNINVTNANGVVSSSKDVTVNGTFYLTPAFVDATENAHVQNYVIDTSADNQGVTSGALTVTKREITVTIDTLPTSVYGANIESVTAKIALTADAGVTGNAALALDETESEVFSLAAAITTKTDVGEYPIVLTLTDKGAANYVITYGTRTAVGDGNTMVHDAYKYAITAATIDDNDTIVGNKLTYNGTAQDILKPRFEVTIVNYPEIAGNAPVWSYAETAADYNYSGKTFTSFTNSPEITAAGTYYYVIKVTAKNHTDFYNNIEVVVDKATLSVSFNLTIMYGEDDPTTVNGGYLFGIENLRTRAVNGNGWTVIGFVNEADEDLFYKSVDGTFDKFYELNGEIRYTINGSFDSKANPGSTFDFGIVFDKLVCDNYEFENAGGTLTIAMVDLTVEIDDKNAIYNEQEISKIPAPTYTLSLPDSTYGNGKYVLTENESEIFTLSTSALTNSNTKITTNKVGEYSIRGNNKKTTIYNIMFKGGWELSTADGGLVAGTDTEKAIYGKYTIKPANLDVKSITGYNEQYDEEWHGISVDGNPIIDPVSGKLKEGITLATANDGSTVIVAYARAMNELSNVTSGDFESATKTDLPAYRNAGRYHVLYKLSAGDNYNVKYGCVSVIIDKADNSLSTLFNFANNSAKASEKGGSAATPTKDAWVYGLYSTDVMDGYNTDGDQTITEAAATFKYTGGANDEQGKLKYELFYKADSTATEVSVAGSSASVTYNSIKAMFDDMFSQGKFKAGDYRLRITLDDSANYYGFTYNFAFKVGKRGLTVTAKDASTTYGENAPKFEDVYTGLVCNSTAADATADTIEIALCNAPVLATEYAIGKNVGGGSGTGDNKGKYYIRADGKDNGTVDAGSFTNYIVTYNYAWLTVDQREVTIEIDDKVNTYNLQGGETLQTLTFQVAAVSKFGIYTSELVDGEDFKNGYNNKNQKLLTLHSDAIVGNNTNDVKIDNGNVVGYTIYATFFNDTAKANYNIVFSGCALKEDKDGAIGANDSVNNAGSYVINKATFSVSTDGVWHDVTKDGVTESVKGDVYSGAVNYYKAHLEDQNKTRIEFKYQVKGSDGQYTDIADNEVVNVGEYKAIGSSSNPNYTAAEMSFTFPITPATLTLTANATSVQYGTKLSGNVKTDAADGGATATGRFAGFTYTASSTTLLPEIVADYQGNIENKVGYTVQGYEVNGAGKTTNAGVGNCTITPACDDTDNIKINAESEKLTVAQREIDVTIEGYESGNQNAACFYQGTQAATQAQLNSLVNDGGADITKVQSFIKVSDGAFGDSGDDEKSLGIKLTLPSDAINVKDGGYEMSYTYNNNNYAITFNNDEDSVPAPTFYIKKAPLTLTVSVNRKVTYGDGLVLDVLDGAITTTDGILMYNVDGMMNKEEFKTILQNQKASISFTAKLNGDDYEAWESKVGEKYTVEIVKLTGVTFANYEIVGYETATLEIAPRTITAETNDQVFGSSGKIAGNGAYAPGHEAVITYADFNKNSQVNGDYRPSYTVSYDTQTNSKYNQTAGKAPTHVGNYNVTIALTEGGNYTFAGGYTTTLRFNIETLKITGMQLRWDPMTYSLDEHPDATIIANTIKRFDSEYMQISSFRFMGSSGNGYTIEHGDENTPGSYYFDEAGTLNVTLAYGSAAVGSYTVSFTLKPEATDNIAIIDTSIPGIADSVFYVTQEVITMTVDFDGRPDGYLFKFDEILPQASVKINDQLVVNNVGVTFAYAKMKTTDTRSNELAVKSKTEHGIVTPDITTEDYEPLVTNISFEYGYYVMMAQYANNDINRIRYYVFKVEKATIDAPTFTDPKQTYNGGVQSVDIAFDSTAVRPVFAGATETTESGMKFLATAAGDHTISFVLIDSKNYEWNGFAGDTVSYTWTISKDNTVNGAEGDKIVTFGAIENATFGGNGFDTAVVNTKDGYAGRIDVYFMAKTDETEPAPGDAGWSTVSGSPVNAGTYWIKVVVRDYGKNFDDKTAICAFTIDPKTVYATATGTITYGDPFENANLRYDIEGLLFGDKEIDNGIAYKLAADYGKLLAGGDYLVTLANTDGVVDGLTAGDNYIIKAAAGKLTVNRRNVTVTIGSMVGTYAVEPDVGDIEFTVTNLAAGDDKSALDIAFDIGASKDSAVGGIYYVTVGRDGDNNYDYDDSNYNIVTVNNGLYTVTALEIEVTLEAQQDITYGDKEIYGARVGNISIVDPDADEQLVRDELMNTAIRFTGMTYGGADYDDTVAPISAGEYTATLVGASSNYKLSGMPSVNFVIGKQLVDEDAFEIEHGIYTGEEQSPSISVKDGYDYDESIYSFGDNLPTFVESGSYDITVELADPFNYTWSSTADQTVTVKFIIDKASDELVGELEIAGWQYGTYSQAFNSPKATVKSGGRVYFEYSVDGGKTYTLAIPSNANAGTYYVRARVNESDNYGEFISSAVKFAIDKFEVAAPTLKVITVGANKNDTYTGADLMADIEGYAARYMYIGDSSAETRIIGGNVKAVAVNAGKYNINFVLTDPTNYKWTAGDDNNDGTLTIEWNIAKKKVARPTLGDNGFVVGGGDITYIPAGFDPSIMIIEGNKYSYGGDFLAVVRLKDTDNYEWATEGRPTVELKWHITGSDTVFAVIISILCVLLAAGAVGIAVQFLLDKRRKSVEAGAMNDIESKDAAENGESGDSAPESSESDVDGQAEETAESDAEQPTVTEGEDE